MKENRNLRVAAYAIWSAVAVGLIAIVVVVSTTSPFLLSASVDARAETTDSSPAATSPAPTDSAPDFIALISYAEHALESITGNKIDISVREKEWKITKTELRYVLESDVKIDGDKRRVIIKIEFDDNTYQSYTVFQLKIDGVNIDL